MSILRNAYVAVSDLGVEGHLLHRMILNIILCRIWSYFPCFSHETADRCTRHCLTTQCFESMDEIPDHATYRGKGINTRLVRHTWRLSLLGPIYVMKPTLTACKYQSRGPSIKYEREKYCIYYPSEVKRGEYWGLEVFLLQYFPLVKI